MSKQSWPFDSTRWYVQHVFDLSHFKVLLVINNADIILKIFYEHYSWPTCDSVALGMLSFRLYIGRNCPKDVNYL